MNSYSFFLFCELWRIANEVEMEYDLMYDKICAEYAVYKKSKFNNPNIGEYECIEEYLEHKQSPHSVYELSESAEIEELKTFVRNWKGNYRSLMKHLALEKKARPIILIGSFYKDTDLSNKSKKWKNTILDWIDTQTKQENSKTEKEEKC